MSKICNYCDHENDSNRQKCAYCGAPLLSFFGKEFDNLFVIKFIWLFTVIFAVSVAHIAYVLSGNYVLFGYVFGIAFGVFYHLLMMRIYFIAFGENND